MSSATTPETRSSNEFMGRVVAVRRRGWAGDAFALGYNLLSPFRKVFGNTMTQTPLPSVGEAAQRDAVADRLQALAAQLERSGYDEAARLAFMAAANLDLTDPELQRSWGGPMNGQQGRAKAFLALLAALEPAAIIETGTYRGTTTEWMASNFAGPIHTCELEPRLFYQARQKLARFDNVHCELIDSRAFLRALLQKLPRDQSALFYLDAHWKEDLPLTDEVSAILAAHPRAVVMIDDFAVPYDQGYAWDDYGPGKRLTLEILIAAGAVDAHVFFPALPSEAETGAKRGCCVLTKNRDLALRIAGLESFRGADWREWRLVELAGDIERLQRENAHLRVQMAHAREAMETHSETHAQEREAWLRAKAEADAALARHERALHECEATMAAQAAQHEQALAERVAAFDRSIAAEVARCEQVIAERATQAEQDVKQLRDELSSALARGEELRYALAAAEARFASEADHRLRLERQLAIMKAYYGIIE